MKFSKNPLLLKLRLKHSRPPIWRDIAIPAKTTLGRLHRYIQYAFEWEDCHLHNFMIGRDVEFLPKNEIENNFYDAYDEEETSVYEIFCVVPKLLYTYDFGDNWEVEITCKGEYLKSPVEGYCQIIKSKGENPPEDCGGIGGFMELLYLREHLDECDQDQLDMLAYYYPEDFEEQNEAKDQTE